jgi:hypothetical protein
MESKISELMNNNEIAKFLDQKGHTLIQSGAVKEHMKKHVEVAIKEHKKSNKLSNMYGKTYFKVKCSELIGCAKDNQQISNMTDKSMVYIKNGKTIDFSYNILKDEDVTVIKSVKSEYYVMFLDTSNDVIQWCEGDTLAEAKECSDKGIYVLASVKDKYKEAKEKHKLSKTLVTSFADIKISLYRLTGNNRNGEYNIGYDYKKIGSNGKFDNTNGKEDFNAKFDSATGTLHVTGTDYNGHAYDEKGEVYKYDLSGKTIKKEEFTNRAIFGNHDNLASRLPNTFTFTRESSMYCPILFDKCFVDKDTINQMLTQANATLVQ